MAAEIECNPEKRRISIERQVIKALLGQSRLVVRSLDMNSALNTAKRVLLDVYCVCIALMLLLYALVPLLYLSDRRFDES